MSKKLCAFIFSVALIVILGVGASTAAPKGPISGPGKVTVGVDASVWDSSVLLDIPNGIFPIGGADQINGGFTIAEQLWHSDWTSRSRAFRGTSRGHSEQEREGRHL